MKVEIASKTQDEVSKIKTDADTAVNNVLTLVNGMYFSMQGYNVRNFVVCQRREPEITARKIQPKVAKALNGAVLKLQLNNIVNKSTTDVVKRIKKATDLKDRVNESVEFITSNWWATMLERRSWCTKRDQLN